nr:hypothetical protein CFP56_21220 [Quercus suber]
MSQLNFRNTLCHHEVKLRQGRTLSSIESSIYGCIFMVSFPPSWVYLLFVVKEASEVPEELTSRLSLGVSSILQGKVRSEPDLCNDLIHVAAEVKHGNSTDRTVAFRSATAVVVKVQ